jgi:regulatory protein
MEYMGTKAYTVEQALEKMRHFCAYQERCHGEVRDRLGEYPLDAEEVEEVISRLIGEDYLNEERFAMAWAGGKFRILHWGRVRIRYELKRKGLSEYTIRKGLASIDEEDYAASLEKLALARWETERRGPGNDFLKRRRVAAFLLRKGYEPDRVREVTEKL